MTTKQKNLIIKNLEEVIGVKTGKSIKGKGIEIFESERRFAYSWSSGINDGSFLARLNNEIAKDPLVVDRLYVKEFYRQDGAPSRYLRAHEMPSIADVISGEALKDCTEISIQLKGTKLYGHLPLSKYDAKDITSIHQLVKDINTLMGYQTSEQVIDSSYDEFDEDITFKGEGECATGGYHSKYSDHCHVHGGLSAMNPDWKEVVEIDGKLSNHNDGVVSDFWDLELDCEKEHLGELDPEGNISVYHRKGKDWYVGYTLHSEEYELYFLNEDGEEEYEYARFQYYKEDNDLLTQIEKSLKALVQECEVKGYIYNELRSRSYYASNNTMWNNNDDIFNLDLIDIMFDGERTEFAHTLLDYVDWEKVTDEWKSPNKEVQKAYTMWLERKVIGKHDNGCFEKFKNIVEGTGYVLSKTLVPNSDYHQHCVVYKGEEYHFMLGEMLEADSAEAFFTKIREALAKRLMEKLEHTVLIQKAANVFVGLQDSLDSGNCNTGTMDFCHRHHIDTKEIGGLRGDVILSMEFSNFTRRAVMQAITKHGSAA